MAKYAAFQLLSSKFSLQAAFFSSLPKPDTTAVKVSLVTPICDRTLPVENDHYEDTKDPRILSYENDFVRFVVKYRSVRLRHDVRGFAESCRTCCRVASEKATDHSAAASPRRIWQVPRGRDIHCRTNSLFAFGQFSYRCLQ